MSVGPMGMIGSAAGSPLAQGQGADVNKAQQDSTDHVRQTRLNEKAEQASGVGQTQQDEEAQDRDADGRRPWEIGPEDTGDQQAQQSAEDESLPKSRDPSGQRGGQLDLTG